MMINKGIKVGFISDLHSFHSQWEIKMFENGKWDQLRHCDIIAFGGDMTSRGTKYEVENFLAWFDKVVPTAQKVFIAGNHDWFFDTKYQAVTDSGAKRWKNQKHGVDEIIQYVLDKYPNLTYLCDSGTEIMGLKFWGSPISPWFNDWAFNRLRSINVNGDTFEGFNAIKPHWDIIPNDTDVLLVHGPPRGKLDLLHPKFRRFNEDPHVGDDDLLDAIENRIKPVVVAFGHIHEGYGVWDPQMSMKEFYTVEEKLAEAQAVLDVKVAELKADPNKASPEWKKNNKAKGKIKSNVASLKLEMERLENLKQSEITYVNASCLNEDYQPMNGPIILNIEGKGWK